MFTLKQIKRNDSAKYNQCKTFQNESLVCSLYLSDIYHSTALNKHLNSVEEYKEGETKH